MNDENYRFILKIIDEHPIILYITGVFLSLVSGAYLMTFLKGLLPQTKSEDKKEGSPAAIIINPSDDVVEKLLEHISEQSDFMTEQRLFYKEIIASIILEKHLDDTIPFREDIFQQMHEASHNEKDPKKS